MSDLSLGDVLAGGNAGPDGVTYPFADNWAQGRTAFGGFTASVLLAGARQSHPELPPLRSALINFTAPVTEGPLVTSQMLRQGRNISTVSAQAVVGGKVAAQGTFSFGASQDSHVSTNLPSAPAQAPEDTESFLPPGMKRAPARFFENFDMKLIEGHRPFSGAETGVTRVWCRHRDEAARGSIEGLMCLADAMPPAVFTICKLPGPNSSVNWICNFLTDTPTTKDGWWMMENTLTATRDGYSSQVMRIWNSDGQLVVEGMQSVIIFV